MYDKSIQITILIKITEEHEAESTFLKNKNSVFVTFRLPQLTELNTFDSDFNCTTRKSTLSHTTVFLLQEMRFAKLNKPAPPSKVLGKNQPPPPRGGLNRGFTVLTSVILLAVCVVNSVNRSIAHDGEKESQFT